MSSPSDILGGVPVARLVSKSTGKTWGYDIRSESGVTSYVRIVDLKERVSDDVIATLEAIDLPTRFPAIARKSK